MAFTQKTVQQAANTSYVIDLGGPRGAVTITPQVDGWAQAVSSDTAPAALVAGDVPAAAGEVKDVIQLKANVPVQICVDKPEGYDSRVHERLTHVRLRCGGTAGNVSIYAH